MTTEVHGRDAVDRVVDGAKCVVFDFHGTLCSELFFQELGDTALACIQGLLWGEDQTLLDQWMAGRVSASVIADHLATPLGFAAHEIEQALRTGCRRLTLNDAVWRFAQAARAAGKRTALVTVNMDVFSEAVAPSHPFDEVFEVVVNSADYGVTDKLRLWPIAFEVLGDVDYADSFLIEDGECSPRKFTEAGGRAYQYTDDAAFSVWLNRRAHGDESGVGT